jgi:8-oxo-dGTP pyrophosphatase MutT (NUDIX family)
MHKKANMRALYSNILEYQLKLEFNFNQSGVIPYRKTKDGTEVLLITSMKKNKWVIPKGFIEFNLSPFESAKKEAYEEAGILGTNETIELGYFSKEKEMGICHVKVFAMEVIEILDDYPEKILRKRQWFKIKEACAAVEVKEISDMINTLESKVRE